MKRIYALALSAVMVLSLTACATAKADNEPTVNEEPAVIDEVGGMIVGGWAYAASPEITDELRKVFDKAFDGFAGSDVKPVAYLGSQVVAGMNHCFLCQSTVVYPGAEPQYVLVYINEGLDGSAELMNIADLDIGSFCEYGGVENDDAIGGEVVQIANPFVDYETLDAAAKAAGFSLTAPETVKGWDGEKVIQVMSNSMIQIIFHDADDNRLFVRKEAGDMDISGDYNVYAEENTVTVGMYSVTLKGSDGMVSTAIWTSNGYSYAVMSDVPLAADAMTALIARVA